MKRLFSLAACAAGFCGFASAEVALAEPTLTLPSVTVAPGGTVSLPVQLNAEVANVSGVSIQLSRSAPNGGPALAVAALDADALPQPLRDAHFDSKDAGETFHAALMRGEPFGGPLDVMTLRLTAPATAAPGAVYPLTATVQLYDPDGAPLSVKLENGSLTIQGGSIRKGDVNADGAINVTDATLALQITVNVIDPAPAQFQAADVNSDNSVNVADAIRILRHIVGLETL